MRLFLVPAGAHPNLSLAKRDSFLRLAQKAAAAKIYEEKSQNFPIRHYSRGEKARSGALLADRRHRFVRRCGCRLPSYRGLYDSARED